MLSSRVEEVLHTHPHDKTSAVHSFELSHQILSIVPLNKIDLRAYVSR